MPVNTASFRSEHGLTDGQILYLRPIEPADQEILQLGFQQLSEASIRERFFNVKNELTPGELRFFTEVDFINHVALIAELDAADRRRAVAVGRFVRKTELPDHSEIAITVIDELHGKGIGKVLLQRLIECARDLNIRYLEASILAQNSRMYNMLHHTGLELKSTTADGIQTITIRL